MINIEKMLNFLSGPDISPQMILQLRTGYKLQLINDTEYTHLCNLLLIPSRYRVTNGATEDCIRTYAEQVCANANAYYAFMEHCKRVRGKLSAMLSDMSVYYWDEDDSVSLNIMGNIVYNVAVQGITYKRAVINAFTLAATRRHDLFNILFLYDFFKDYLYVQANGEFYTPYMLTHAYADVLNTGDGFTIFRVYEKTSVEAKLLPIYVTAREVFYTPRVQMTQKISVKEASKIKTNYESKIAAKPQNKSVCTLEHWLNSKNTLFAVYTVYSEKVQQMSNKSDIELCGHIPGGAKITNILEITSTDKIKFKPTKELQDYLMCRTAGTSYEANVWHTLRGSLITRDKVTQCVDMLKCVYFTDDIGVSTRKHKYIHISEMEMYLLKDAAALTLEKLKKLKFYVKIGEFYIETVGCSLHIDYMKALLSLAKNKLNY